MGVPASAARPATSSEPLPQATVAHRVGHLPQRHQLATHTHASLCFVIEAVARQIGRGGVVGSGRATEGATAAAGAAVSSRYSS